MHIRKFIKRKIHIVIRIWNILYFTCGKENKSKDWKKLLKSDHKKCKYEIRVKIYLMLLRTLKTVTYMSGEMYVPITSLLRIIWQYILTLNVYILSVSSGKYMGISLLEEVPPTCKDMCIEIFIPGVTTLAKIFKKSDFIMSRL